MGGCQGDIFVTVGGSGVVPGRRLCHCRGQWGGVRETSVTVEGSGMVLGRHLCHCRGEWDGVRETSLSL